MAYELRDRVELLQEAFRQIEDLPLDEKGKTELCMRLALTETKVLRDILESDSIRRTDVKGIEPVLNSPYVQ